MLVSIEEIDQTFETAFGHIRKRVESRQKYTVTRHVFNSYHDCFAFLAVSLHFLFSYMSSVSFYSLSGC